MDTNILIGAAYNEGSASAWVVEQCRTGRLIAIGSDALFEEYRYIVPRAVRRGDPQAWLDAFLREVILVEPASTPRILSFDSSDDILFHAAIAGGAAYIVTNDRPVLQVREYEGVQVVRPVQLREVVETRR